MKKENTKSSECILIIEDDAAYAGSVKKWIEGEGYRTMAAADAVEGLERFRTARPGVVLLDLSLPPSNTVDEGLALLREILKLDPDGKVLILTGEGTTEAAIESMHLGAEDFFLKPLDPDVLLIVIERALYKKALEGEIRALRRKLFEGGFNGIIGRSAPMRQLYDNLGQVAASQANVLIVGENGTGKELIAQIIHALSSRRDKRMIPLNCAALSEGVCESELFGHEKGAFTDADRRRLGAFELADRGSLFLDEVGDIPPRIQVKLLRAIEEKRFQRVGGNDVIDVDFRVICATNRDLGRMIGDGLFREDLYHRLSTVILRVPPLRERVEDIPLLANHFLDVYGRIENRNIVSINPEVLELFRNYHW
ncbi:sigma-54-dependent transcriptional regulator, partial [Thermodesulfobacteriota bacterium]